MKNNLKYITELYLMKLRNKILINLDSGLKI